jgi:hypothetical protein
MSPFKNFLMSADVISVLSVSWASSVSNSLEEGSLSISIERKGHTGKMTLPPLRARHPRHYFIFPPHSFTGQSLSIHLRQVAEHKNKISRTH